MCFIIIFNLGRHVNEGVEKLRQYNIWYKSSVRAVRGWQGVITIIIINLLLKTLYKLFHDNDDDGR